MTTARVVKTLFPTDGEAAVGDVRVTGPTPNGGHPADGMTACVWLGGGAVSTIVNPQSFDDGGPEWVMRYGNPQSIRFTAASLIESYDYLLSQNISEAEASRRLRIMRAARAVLATTKEQADV